MIGMGRMGVALAVVLGWAIPAAHADDAAPMEHMWPAMPSAHMLSLEDQITDHLSAIGNLLGDHIDFLSHDFIGLHVDGRGQRARLRVGAGNAHYLTFRFDSDWHFADGKARVNARVHLGLAGHEIDMKLPAMDLTTDSYHGESMVTVNIPVLEKHF
jgi:hypothetical protein